MAPRAQRTIKAGLEFSGRGLHSGEDVRLALKPAQADHGIVFSRVDLEGSPCVEAHISKLVVRERRTSLRDGMAEVGTIEHLMSALFALQIDNVLVEISGEEVPGMDGSSRRNFASRNILPECMEFWTQIHSSLAGASG